MPPTRHSLTEMHRSTNDTTGADIAVDKVLVTDGSGGFTYEDYNPVPPEPPGPGFHHVLVKRTSDFTTTNTNDSAPDYDHVIADTMVTPWWTVGQPDRLEVTAEYDGLPAIIDSACAWADPGSAAYVEGKVYCFPAASGRDRPIADDGSDEQYLLRVDQRTADDNVNNFPSVTTFPRIMAEGDIVIVAWRTPSSQTAIEYPVGEDAAPVSITLGAWVPSTPGPEGPAGSLDVTDGTTTVDTTVLEFNPAAFDVVDEGAGTARVDFVGSVDPADDAFVWMPLTTIDGGEPVLVWDGDDNLIPTLTPI